MKPTTLKALKESIAHWKRLANGKAKRGESIGADDCALCGLFLENLPNCHGCPVRDRTNKRLCYGSPYRNANDKHNVFGQGSAQFKTAALEELDFLKSLLPKKAKPSRSSSAPAAKKAP